MGVKRDDREERSSGAMSVEEPVSGRRSEVTLRLGFSPENNHGA